MKQVKFSMLALFVGLMFHGLTNVANADETIVFRDNFETDTAGTSPTTADLNPVIGAGDIGGSWTVQDTSQPAVVQVLNDSAIASNSITGSNFLSMKRTNGDRPVWGSGWTASETVDQWVEVSFSVYVPSTGGGTIYMYGVEDAVGDSAHRIFDLRFDENGYVKSYNGTSVLDTGIPFNTDEWNQVILWADMKNQTFSLKVGNRTATGLTWVSGRNQAGSINFGTFPDGSQNYIDNVQVTVVERDDLVKFSDDFETDVAGTSPTTADLDPVIGPRDIGGSWYIDDSVNPDVVQVLNDSSIASNSITGNNFLSLNRYNWDRTAWVTGWTATETEDEQVELSFSVYITYTNSNAELYIVGVEGAVNDWVNRMFDLRFKNGNVEYYKDGTHTDTGIDYIWNAWNQVILLADMKTQTFKVTVGSNTATGLSWPSGLNKVGSIAMGHANATMHSYIDNFELSVVSPLPSGTLIVIK